MQTKEVEKAGMRQNFVFYLETQPVQALDGHRGTVFQGPPANLTKATLPNHGIVGKVPCGTLHMLFSFEGQKTIETLACASGTQLELRQ